MSEDGVGGMEYWPLPLVMFLILGGGFGNCLVCLAISTNKELQNMTNYFLMSLGVADLLVCMVVMPFGAMVIFQGGNWPLSQFWCVFYQTCDVLGCSVSILHLMFISIGRYRGISKPLMQRQESERAVFWRIVLTWGLGLILASPIPVLAAVDIEQLMEANSRCEVKNRHFRLLGSLFSFYIPMKPAGILGSRHVITRHAAANRFSEGYNYSISNSESIHRCCRTVSNRSTQTPNSISREIMLSTREGRPLCSTATNGFRKKSTYSFQSSNGSKQASGRSCRSNRSLGVERYCDKKSNGSSAPGGCSALGSSGPGRCSAPGSPQLLRAESSNHNGSASPKSWRKLVVQSSRSQIGVNNAKLSEEKASRVLGIVFSCFILCWTPFFLLNLVTSICESCEPPSWLGDIALWSGWVSSTINPLIYTIFNIKFRRCFARLLKCQCVTRKPNPRPNNIF